MATGGGSGMFDREVRGAARSLRHGRPSGLAICTAVVTLALVGWFAAIALGVGSATPVVGSASNVKFEERIVVDAQGLTLYALSPETTHRLLCKSGECLRFWRPLTVRSRKAKLTAGSGVHGKLGILRRSNGMLQVTLRGLPLYRFSGDSAKGAVNGENVKSFGGTWHAISAASSATPVPSSTETTPAPTTSTPAPTPSTPTPTPTTTPAPAPPPVEKYGY
jgi:predicted lipoprotein with Yx(FWY)xxD motif